MSMAVRRPKRHCVERVEASINLQVGGRLMAAAGPCRTTGQPAQQHWACWQPCSASHPPDFYQCGNLMALQSLIKSRES